jgi:hypothetical protein
LVSLAQGPLEILGELVGPTLNLELAGGDVVADALVVGRRRRRGTINSLTASVRWP